MKKSSTKKRTKNEDYELRDEYDLSKMTVVAKGRFAPHRRVGTNVIVLAPDLLQAFPSGEAVLEISQIPSAPKVKKVRRPRSVSSVGAA